MGAHITRPHERLLRKHSKKAMYLPKAKGGNGLPYADDTHFYKMRYFDSEKSARRAARHAMRTKDLIPGYLACHAILAEQSGKTVLIKYPRHERDMIHVLENSNAHELDQKMVQVLTVVHEMHKLGVVHGDLKPANVLVTKRSVLLADLDTLCKPRGKRKSFTHSYSPSSAIVRSLERNKNYTWFEKMRALDLYAVGRMCSDCARCFDSPTRWGRIASLLTNQNILNFFDTSVPLVTMTDALIIIAQTDIVV